MSKINFADFKEFKKEAVVRFICDRVKTWSIQEAYKDKLATLKKERDAAIDNKDAEKALKVKKAIADIMATREKELANFKYKKSDEDKALEKKCREKTVMKADVFAWLEQFGIQTDDATFANRVINSVGYAESKKIYVLSGGEKGLEIRYSQIVKNAYWCVWEELCKQKRISEKHMPDILKEKFKKQAEKLAAEKAKNKKKSK